MYRELTEELLEFIEKSPSPFHAVQTMKDKLEQSGFVKLEESSRWELQPGSRCYVTRNHSSLIAFQIPHRDFNGFHIIASHSDSPTFKIKENAEITAENRFTKLNVEKYGGMLCAPWLDRPLSIAGRVMVQEGNRLISRLVNIDRDLVLIPNLAIHMNRQVNDGYAYNPQADLLPLFGDETAAGKLLPLIAEAANTQASSIMGTDLFLYNRVKGCIWGANEEYFSSARLDDLQCAFSSLKGFLESTPVYNVTVHCVLDNEEVGSTTKQGAASTFLKDTLTRINQSLSRSGEDYHRALASSFMLSADNAHCVHPNHPDKADPSNRPYMNGGIVIKYNANQKYTTDAVSASVFKSICSRAQVPFQTFTNRSDMAGGSTLGNISNTQAALNTVDIGLAQLAMHSPYETAGVKDTFYLVKAAGEFYRTALKMNCDGEYQFLDS